MKTSHRLIIYSILSFLILGLAIDRLTYIHRVAQTPSHSFISYFVASKVLAVGEDAHQLYDRLWFNQQVAKITPDIEEYYQPNPPTTSLLMLPLVHFGHDHSRVLWTLFSLVSVIVAIAWIIRHYHLNILYTQLLLLTVLVYQPLYANFRYAQVYGVLFALLTMLLFAYTKYDDIRIGLCLGLMLTFKLVGYLFIPLLIIKRRWLALMSTGIVGLSIVLLSLPRLKIQSWIAFFDMLPQHNQRPSFAVTAYQSIPSFFRHHFMYHETWNPSPLINAPLLATVLSSSVIMVLLVVTFWRAYRSEQSNLIIGSLVLLTVLMGPASLDYHYTIVLLPILLMIAEFQQMTIMGRMVAIIGIFLLAVDYPYQDAIYERTVLSVLAYPKLIGALLLWFVTVQQMKLQPQYYQSSNSGA